MNDDHEVDFDQKEQAVTNQPKPRKHMRLYQAYAFYNEISMMGVRHKNRLAASQSGRSDMDGDMEENFLSWIEPLKRNAAEIMVSHGEDCDEIWTWVTSIRGMKNGALAASLLAQIDDIAKFDTVSKLWRFAGQAVINGQAERNVRGERAHRNGQLASVCYNISEQFIRQQTPMYVDIYYAEKYRLRQMYPEKVENTRKNSLWPFLYTDNHVHRMAKRKMIKVFLQHLWIQWRTFDNLPVNEPYVQAVLGHTHIILPPSIEEQSQ